MHQDACPLLLLPASLVVVLLAMQCFEAVNGTKFDATTLYKPAGWKPCQEDAEKYYATLAAVPTPPGEHTQHDFKQGCSLLLQMPTNVALLACY